ncbi:MAG: dihydroorotate dehydrogenase electron transfer subunit [Candidatus Omnitrophica bacterium]|nr:dihydroorotate dehydrogenase electron transfer subunit [Candidatus Omnitrophota bacterium]
MGTKKQIVTGTIKENIEISPNLFIMKIEETKICKEAKPGQFVNIKLTDSGSDPLLRIPLGIYNCEKNGLSLMYKVVGEGTTILSKKKKNETINILGPIGNGFNIREKTKNSHAILVAGGCGFPPLSFLANELKKKRIKTTFLMGASGKDHISCCLPLAGKETDVYISTDDGSIGKKGTAVDLLKEILANKKNNGTETIIYACGPGKMLENVSKTAKAHNIQTQISVEEYMACGIGACKGCAIKTKQGIKLVCKDGPVFNAEDIY